MAMQAWLIGVGALLLFDSWRSHGELRNACVPRKRSVGPAGYPSLSIIRPIRGLDAGAELNLRAALDVDYPGAVETIFVFDDATEPAVPLVRRLLREREDAWLGGALDLAPNGEIVFCGSPPARRTGKLNAMIAGLRRARGELVAFIDSDTRPRPGTWAAIVAARLGRDDAGCAFAPVVVTEPHRTVGDAGYALLLNGLYGPAAALTADRQGGTLPFIMGQLMVFKREALAAIGGLESTEGQLVDDMHLGKLLHDAGYANVVAPVQLPIIQEGLPLTDFVHTYVRWITFSRSGLPALSFKAISWRRAALFWLGVGLTVAAVAFGLPFAALIGALVPLSIATSINALHRALGGARLAPRHLWVSFGLLLAGPLVLMRAYLQRELDWRGRRYALDPSSRLASRTTARSAPAEGTSAAPEQAL